ncbi:Rieske (2Fe-2S) domain-containing protein [Bacillus freudenreichii]|nr:Rieske (2Fe-2S) domain-containing protein [Bacillus freudenreichii]
MESVENYVYLMSSDSLIDDEPVETVLEGNILVVARVDGKVYAVDGICTHAYAELIDGGLDGHCLTCPLHFACFDIRDGSVMEGPTDVALKTYEVKEEDGNILIKL